VQLVLVVTTAERPNAQKLKNAKKKKKKGYRATVKIILACLTGAVTFFEKNE
jgi:hypothetical protein